MGHFLEKTWQKIIARPYITAGIAVVVVAGGAWAYSVATRAPQFEFVEATRKETLAQEVSVTGKVKAARDISLSFEKTGKVAAVRVETGQKVAPGQVLAYLDNQDARANIAKAEASVQLQEAKLEEAKKGARPEEIAIQETKVRASERAIMDTEQNLREKIQDAYTKSDDAARNSIDQIFVNSQTSLPPYKFLGNNPQLEIDLEWERGLLEGLLKNWTAELERLEQGGNLKTFADVSEKNLKTVRSLADKAALLANSFSATPPYTETTIDGWKAEISAARANVNTAIFSLLSAKEKLENARSDLDIARKELALKKAGATPEAIRAQEASLAETKAVLMAAEAELSKTIIRAPISGIITKRSVEPGEVAQAQTVAFAIISASDFEIEANIPETDIAWLALGQNAKITLDAYGDRVTFEGKVRRIDPAETVVEGIPTYGAKIQFSKKDSRIKSGLTANVDILIAERKNVIVLPSRAIAEKDGKMMVKVLVNGKAEEIEVKIGLKGSDGTTEITEGIHEGEKVIISND